MWTASMALLFSAFRDWANGGLARHWRERGREMGYLFPPDLWDLAVSLLNGTAFHPALRFWYSFLPTRPRGVNDAPLFLALEQCMSLCVSLPLDLSLSMVSLKSWVTQPGWAICFC